MADDGDDRPGRPARFAPLHGNCGPPVGWSEDLDRIVNLPRRTPVAPGSATSEALIDLAMSRYSRGERTCACSTISPLPCITRFLHVQAWMLHEMTTQAGLIAAAPIGAGKTLSLVLAPLAVPDCKLALMLIPSSLVDQIQRDYKRFAEHFRVPNIRVYLPDGKTFKPNPEPQGVPMLHVMAYPQLSTRRKSRWIEDLKPDLIIADECDAIAGWSSRRIRVARAFAENPDMRFVGMTGSLTDNSISEMWHLFLWALRERSPMPMYEPVVEEWGAALDAVPNPSEAGELVRLCRGKEDARAGFQRRLRETAGVVIVTGETVVHTPEGVKVELLLRSRDPGKVPDIIQKALDKVDAGFRPDTLGGAEFDIDFETPMEKARCGREVSSGMFYKWIFPPRRSPHNADHAIRTRWFLARRNWFAIVREMVLRGAPFMDSPKLLEEAAQRGWGDVPDNSLRPSWRPPEWPEWRDVRDMIKPEQTAVRLDKYLVDDAARWAAEAPGIVWYSTKEFAQWLRELHGIPMFEGGMGEALMKEDGSRSIAVSINAHGRGRDGLQQMFNRQLIAQFPSSSRRVQQLLGRAYRRGQKSSQVITDTYRHLKPLRDAYDQAVRRAEYVEELIGETHLLLSATR